MTSPTLSEPTPPAPAEEAPARRRVGRFLSFLSLALGVMALLHGYLGARLLVAAPGPLRDAGWLLLLLLFASIPGGLILGRFFPNRLTHALQAVGKLWMGTFAILLTAVVLMDVIVSAARLLGPAAWLSAHRPALAFGLAVGAVVFALWSARFRLVVERVEVPLAGLGRGLEGLRVVQLSDVHIGESLDRRFLQRVVDRVNALAPDVVVITGDLVDGDVDALREEVEPLRQLRAAMGTYYVIGNHELYWGAREWVAQVKALGLTVLHNEHRLLTREGARLALGGVPDVTTPGFLPELPSSPALAFQGAPEGVPRVLLAHQPKSAEAAAAAGVSLQLSGHTHAGQIFPFNFFVRLQQPVVRGLKRLHGMWIYTHRGTGYWGPPMRLGAPPEIAVLTLRGA